MIEQIINSIPKVDDNSVSPTCHKPLLNAVFGDSEIEILSLKNESVDIICIDPPYLYLKNQKLERPFDEVKFFRECKRILTKDGFVILFGRGASFYRWNTIISDLGFTFKEEVIWDKSYCSSPLMAMSRVHETVAIFTKGKGVINKVKVPYLEMKQHNFDSIVSDIKRLNTIWSNDNHLKAVLDYIANNLESTEGRYDKSTTVSNSQMRTNRSVSTVKSIKVGLNKKSIIRSDRSDCSNFTKHGVNTDKRKSGDRCANIINSMSQGMNEKTIIRSDYEIRNINECVTYSDKTGRGNRVVDVVNSICEGMNEKSILKQRRDHYDTIHPTQKPVRLLERLISLVIPKSKEVNVVDFFAGSFSCGEACYNLGLNFTGYEIDEEYFQKGRERLKNIQYQQRLF